MAVTKGGWSSPEDWNQWSDWLAAGLHARNRWRLPVLLLGMLLASGRRTVTTWLLPQKIIRLAERLVTLAA